MKVKVLGVPSDFGANRRGVDMGPSAIRYAGLIDKLKELKIKVEDISDINIPITRSDISKCQKLKCLDEIVVSCEALSNTVSEVVSDGYFPIVLGGDHSIAIGSVAGVSRVKESIGLIWIDAHGDFNTQKTSNSGNIHGMPLSAIVGKGVDELVNCGGFSPKVKEENTVLVGVRDLDEGEKRLLKESKLTIFTMDDIDRKGMYQIMKEAIRISSKDVEGVHLSFDIDVLDPLEAPGVGTPVKGGISYREAHLALEMLSENEILTSLDLVEVNPILDQYNKTAELAVELILSALGKRIL
ncbi:arginase [Orenia marismortui]|uniref:Arginase n=1 Tax=Orenia marismortui TaxID=46469 RepID=A0A4R8GXI0_9FIRM|nr:arginase [Orenia marismortui]TDX50927.1 arginase [Orenia marismortui]